MLLRLAVVAAVACALAAHDAHEDAKPDCPKSGDGYYVKGCSAKFWRCVNDRLYSYDCPKGLYFNPLKRKCEYKADVPICMEGVKFDSKNVVKASAEFNCTGLDGSFKPRDIACSNTFITCFAGFAAEQACPFGQFFHEEHQACDFKDNVPGCLKTETGSKIGGSISLAACPALRSGHVDIPCNADEVCQKIERPVNGKYSCPAPFAVWYGPLGLASADQWTLAPEGLKCGADGRWYNGNTPVATPAVDCTAKKSAMARDQTTYGAAAPAPPARSPAVTSVNEKAAALNACPGLTTGKDSEGIPCDADEVCQAIHRPKNGRYSCEAPFMVYYGPVKGASAQWKMAKEGLVCGADGFWYDNGAKVDASGIDCTAKKADFKQNDDETQGCPSLSTNEREIPCKGDHEICNPILKAVAGKYACPTPYRVWYGPRGGDESLWKQAKDALICKSGQWFDGDVKIDASAVDCTVKKIDCSKLGDGTYNGEPGRCSTHFWQCSNEQAYLYPCPPGLFFDDFSKTCDFKEVVESCGGVRRSPAAATTTAAPAADAAVIRKTDCPTVLTDSTLPCREGEACVAPKDPVNQKYLCETPYTLSFGPKANLEQWRQAPNGIQCKDGRWFNGEEQIAPEAVHCTTQKFACSGKKDGAYTAHPEKCTAYFWNCAHDDAFLYTCPTGLFFDVDTLSCDYKEVIVACGGVKKDKELEKKEVKIPSADSSPVSGFDCAGKDNGYHETAKCQKKFWNCADGKAFQMDCPEGLLYDGRVQLCQYPVACTGELPATTTTTLPPSTLDHGDISQKPALPTTSFDCSSKPDGIYAEKKCHKQYVECSNGRTFAKECPAGLVYTTFNKACDYKQTCMNPPTTAAPSTTPAAAPAQTTAYSSYATYERGTATTKAPVAPVAPASFDKPNCANLENGAHALTRCGAEFFMCWKGESSFSKCNDGLIFNPLNSQCDYRSNVIECGPAADATATTAAPGKAGPPSPPTAAPITPDLFCEGRQDGHFGSGCQSFFYSCQNGATTKMFCPMGLHYDADSKTCDQRELIVACGGKKEGTSTPAADPAPSTYHSVPLVKDTPAPVVEKFCVGKEDGFHSHGCQDFFYSCQSGMTHKMMCPPGLFYDTTRKSCDRKEDIVACGAAPVATQAPTTPAAAPASSYQRVQQPAPVQPVAPVKDINVPVPVPVFDAETFCVGKEDGFHAPGCQPFFFSCMNGQTHKMACPSGLFYDTIKKACDNREDIVACGAPATQAPTTPAAASASSSFQRTQPTVAPVKDVPVVAAENFCIGKETGYYSAKSCEEFYYFCQSGVAHKMHCPAGLYYDADKKQCENKETIVGCGAAPVATQAPTTPAAAPASSSYQRIQPVAPVKDTPVVDAEKFCIGKNAGYYSANSCKDFYYFCQSGVAYKMHCPAGLFYDADQKKCENKETIVGCGAAPVPTQAPTTPAAAPASSYHQTIQPVPHVQDPVAPIEKFCEGKTDAFYGEGCQSFFYSCQSGMTYKMACPSTLFYDAVNKKCDNKDDVVACGAAATQAPVTKASDIPAVPIENFCNGKTDGFYALGCASFFYSCQSGSTYKMTCPSGLFYDVVQKMCLNREETAACGSVPVPATTAAPTTTTPAAAPAQTTVAPSPYAPKPAHVPAVITANFCAGKADAIYGAGCQNFFYSCQSGVSYKTTCSSGLFFDVDSKQCNYKEFIVACGGKKEEIVPATAAPVTPALDTPATLDTFCLAKEDGFYGLGCATFFYSCQSSATYKMLCPAGLYYDVPNKACDRKEEIVACGANPSTPSIALAPAAPAYASPAVSPSRDQPATPLITPENICSGKVDGFYGNGCVDHFFACENGNTHKMDCPLGLFYDDFKKSCEQREEILACGGTHAIHVSPTAAPAQAMATAAPVRDVVNFCSGKADGIYLNGCESFYTSCVSGTTYKMACPASLFYDVATKMCDVKEKVAACGGNRGIAAAPAAPSSYVQPAATAAPVRNVVPIASVPENFCTGKLDGIYLNGCESFYTSCVAGATYKMACPASLFYDVHSKMCDVKEKVAACGGKQAVAAAPAAPYVQPAHPAATAAPVRDNVNFCAGKVDGIYLSGCESFYTSCSNGMTYKMACPSGLFYDIHSKMCDAKENVAACGGKKTAAPALPVAPSQYVQPITAPVRDTVPVVPSNNFCAGKADGIYLNGCESFYTSCVAGATYKMACPSGLFFDVHSKMCDAKENVAACGGKKTAAPALPVAPSQYVQPITAPVRDTVPVVPTDNFCAGKADGIYLKGCESFYTSCVNGATYKMACPSGLFFDVLSKMCDQKENVAACGGQKNVASAPAVPAVPAPYAQPPQHMATAAPVENFCAGKADGIYLSGCESYYTSCVNGMTYKMACPSNLFFDVHAKVCDVKENVAVCGGKRATAPAVPAPYAQHPQQPMATAAPVRDNDNFCAGKTDGIYLNGCESFYTSCVAGATYKMACPAGLFFNVHSKMCDVKENVAACGGKITVAAAPAVPAVPAPYAQPAQQMATAAPVENFCAGKTDGIYLNGCESYYTSCVSGATYKMACPSGLFFDIHAKVCDIKDNVAACGGKRMTAAAPAVLATPAPYTQPAQPMATPAPVRDTANFCAGKADGIYLNGCESFYTSCANGMAYKMACPSGLFFDVHSKMCDIKENVAACGGQKSAAPAAPAPFVQPAQPMATAAPLRDVDNFCAGKADGVYLNGCESFYRSCANGVTYKMACPSGLFFDIHSKMCDQKENVAACGGKKNVAAAPAVPAVPAPYAQPPQPMATAAPVENFCAGKTDGIYVNGCESFYTHCVSGATYKMACPSGTFFDVHAKVCDIKENVAACGGKRTPVTAPVAPAAAPAVSAPSPYAQPATIVAPVRDTVPVVPTENFCAGKTDGIYLNGCESYYTSCVAGATYKMACPSGLFFDVATSMCDVKEHVAACGGKRSTIVAPLVRDQPAPPVDNFCVGKADGWYAEGCQSHYYSCLAGTTYKMACPASLFYDTTRKACFRREEITGCGAAAAAPAAPVSSATAVPQYTSSAPAAPSAPATPDNFCAGKADGVHTVGCAAFYYSCSNGNTIKMACPSNLFYDATAKRCEVRENVVACGGQQPQQQQPQSQYQPALTTTVPVRDVIVPVANNFCSGKADGSYGEGCQHFFYYCANGATSKMDCAAGLAFDVTSRQCQYKENVVACGGAQPTPAAAPAAPAAPAYSQPAATAAPAAPAASAEYSKPAAPVKDKPVVKSVNDRSCMGQVNGFFGEGCNPFFYSCMNNAAYKMDCPAGLFYDLELQSCEYKDFVPNCGGRRLEVTATPSPALDKLSPAPVSNTACSGKADGIYPAADCAAEFLSCQAGLARKEACQEGLFYNENNKMCDYRENVAKCSARDTLPTRAPVADYGRTPSRPITRPAAPKTDAYKQEQQKTKPALSPAGTSCAAAADGYYSNGCSSDYSACVSGSSMAMHCPAGLMYSASTQMCDYQDNVPECGGSVPLLKDEPAVSPRPLVLPATPSPVMPVTPKTKPAQAPVKEVHPRCAGRSDGIYALAPCSQHYIACVDEKATIGICREDLFYSTVTGLCDWKEKISACTILVRPTSTVPRAVPTTTPLPVTAAPVVRPAGERLIRPTVPLGVTPDCSLIADGVYAVNSCSPYYTRCTGGRLTARGTCPKGLVFSSASSSCVARSGLASCSAPITTAPVTAPATTQAPALAPAQPNYGVQQAQQQQPMYQQQQQVYPQQQQQYGNQMQQQQPTYSQQYAPSYNTNPSTYGSGVYADPTQFCYGKGDGIYGNTCQKNYVICKGGATFAFQCPNEFIFNRERAVCDHPSRMPQCGGPTYGYAPVASYQQPQSYSSYQQPQQQQSYSPY